MFATFLYGGRKAIITGRRGIANERGKQMEFKVIWFLSKCCILFVKFSNIVIVNIQGDCVIIGLIPCFIFLQCVTAQI